MKNSSRQDDVVEGWPRNKREKVARRATEPSPRRLPGAHAGRGRAQGARNAPGGLALCMPDRVRLWRRCRGRVTCASGSDALAEIALDAISAAADACVFRCL